MKYLIVYAHPDPKSFNHAIMETISDELKKKKREFTVRGGTPRKLCTL